ncbi:MAG: ABC transporter permease subunit, partial [Clostridiaceae bacterium]|nr:ABC transporter permease subunit [Clostridiaceae bacterium]
ARTPGKLSKMLHLASLTSLAIPGIVLGLSYVLFFKGSLIYGSLAILILVNLVHFFASPYLMIYNTLAKINEHLEAVGQTLGVSRAKIIRDVIIPQSAATLGEMFCYFFVNSMMTISAVAFLATASTRPLSLMITSFEAQMMLECAAFIALMILAVNLLVRGIFALYKRKISREAT